MKTSFAEHLKWALTMLVVYPAWFAFLAWLFFDMARQNLDGTSLPPWSLESLGWLVAAAGVSSFAFGAAYLREGGGWPSYAELEAENARLKAALADADRQFNLMEQTRVVR